MCPFHSPVESYGGKVTPNFVQNTTKIHTPGDIAPKKTYLIIHCDIPKCSYDQCRGLATSVHSIYPTVKPPEFFHIVAPHIQPCSQTVSYTT